MKVDSPMDSGRREPAALVRKLSPLTIWALSLGCAVGWGAFVMPGTTFLPVAGPVGTALGVAIGALIMLVIGVNYNYLLQRHPDAGGAFSYVKSVCNHDHGYLCAWFLILTYTAIVWANATALALIGRNLLGGIFSVGPHYTIAGYDVWLGEILLSIGALLAIHALMLAGRRVAATLQTALALLLVVGVVVCFTWIFFDDNRTTFLSPAFASPAAGGHIFQILGIVVLAPWAFVGFEAVSHFAEEFAFPRRRTIWILCAALATGALCYILLTFIAASIQPTGFTNWREYVAQLGTQRGVAALPAFYAIETALGRTGLILLCLTTLAAILTGLIGHLATVSRLLLALSRDKILPEWFGRLSRNGTPVNAQSLIVALSCLVPFAGRTAIGWIVDVTTIGASIAYGYVSYCAFAAARRSGRRTVMATGLVGLAVSALFVIYFLVPNFWTIGVFATESYLILSLWAMLGLAIFLWVFKYDEVRRLGKSTVAWIVPLFLIFFSSHMWMRQSASWLMGKVTDAYAAFYAEGAASGAGKVGEAAFRAAQHDYLQDTLTRYNLAQISLVVLTLGFMFAIYSTITRREREAAQAKGYFFSTVSHDIRTPLNAIIGFSQMLKAGFKTKEETTEAVDSILVSSKTLLSLINDILDLSKLESGKMAITPEPTDCPKLLHEIVDALHIAARKPGLELRVRAAAMPKLLLDPQRLRQIAFNLIGNAVKFTEKGFVEIRASFAKAPDASTGLFTFEVEDTGVGISEEDQKRIATPYVQLDSKHSRHGGTGLGLAITKQLVAAMDGTFSFSSALGHGTTFHIAIPNVQASGEVQAAKNRDWRPAEKRDDASAEQPSGPVAPAHKAPRVLLVDDVKVNLVVLKALLKRVGSFDVETAANGVEAMKMLSDPEAKPFDIVLTDMWMPEMDGEGLVKAIRANPALAALPVYAITADVELQKDFAERGFTGLRLKPLTLESLRETCAAVMG